MLVSQLPELLSDLNAKRLKHIDSRYMMYPSVQGSISSNRSFHCQYRTMILAHPQCRGENV